MSILVAVDFSNVTERLLTEAISVAGLRGAQVWLVHVAEPEPDFIGYEAGPDVVRDQVAAEYREEHRQLQKLAARIESAGVDVVPLLVQGAIVETILDQAERHDVDMIVMGTHGHGLVYQILVGSVSEGVLRAAKVPVLLVPVEAREPAA